VSASVPRCYPGSLDNARVTTRPALAAPQATALSRVVGGRFSRSRAQPSRSYRHRLNRHNRTSFSCSILLCMHFCDVQPCQRSSAEPSGRFSFICVNHRHISACIISLVLCALFSYLRPLSRCSLVSVTSILVCLLSSVLPL
jgi:hypothetical protein